MKKSILAMGLLGSLALAGTAAPAFADGEEEAASSGFSGYVTLTSDYRFRGVSQSDNSAALQGAIRYTHETGLFLEAWASNVDFSEFGDPDTSIEVDLTAGYDVSLSDYTDFSIKAVYYLYPDEDTLPGVDDISYWEFIAGISRKLGTSTVLTLEAAYAPDIGSDGGVAWAGTAGIDFPVMEKLWFFDGLNASAHFGVQGFDEDATSDDYTFWDFGLSTSYDMLTLDARYVDTDLDVIECGLDPCEGGMMFSATIEWGG